MSAAKRNGGAAATHFLNRELSWIEFNQRVLTSVADNCRARRLQPDGSWTRARPARRQAVRRSQVEFMAMAVHDLDEGTKSARRRSRYPAARLAARAP